MWVPIAGRSHRLGACLPFARFKQTARRHMSSSSVESYTSLRSVAFRFLTPVYAAWCICPQSGHYSGRCVRALIIAFLLLDESHTGRLCYLRVKRRRIFALCFVTCPRD